MKLKSILPLILPPSIYLTISSKGGKSMTLPIQELQNRLWATADQLKTQEGHEALLRMGRGYSSGFSNRHTPQATSLRRNSWRSRYENTNVY